MSGEWTLLDAPAVRAASDGDQSCTSCGTWSSWIGNAGDCLFHAYKRRQEMIDDVPREERTASKSARMTSGDEVCDGWRRIEGR